MRTIRLTDEECALVRWALGVAASEYDGVSPKAQQAEALQGTFAPEGRDA